MHRIPSPQRVGDLVGIFFFCTQFAKKQGEQTHGIGWSPRADSSPGFEFGA